MSTFRQPNKQPDPIDWQPAMRELLRCADWYRRCLEDVQDGHRVTGLKEAKALYDRSTEQAWAVLKQAVQHGS